jgi:cell division protein FtsB
MARTTSTQGGASRRTTTASGKRSGGPGAKSRTATTKRGASGPRKPASRGRTASSTRRAKVALPAGPWVPVIVVGLVAVLGWSLYPALRLQYQTSRRAAGLEQQYQALKQRNQALSAQVAELKTPAGVEKAARETLGYTKKGDNVYVVMPDGSTGPTSAVASSVASGTDRSLIQTVLDALFGVAPPATPGLEP